MLVMVLAALLRWNRCSILVPRFGNGTAAIAADALAAVTACHIQLRSQIMVAFAAGLDNLYTCNCFTADL